jgi:hypothetical protein
MAMELGNFTLIKVENEGEYSLKRKKNNHNVQ